VNGCPTAAAPAAAAAPALADSDGDSVPDAQDACPKEKGELTKDAATAGCPPAAPTADSDGDGVPNAEDACPKDKGAATGDAKNTKGCPKYVRVTEAEIEMSSPIQFRVLKNDMAPLDPSAEPILTEVRDAIAQHPELVKLEVQAHTDDSGDKKFNETISTARAEAVRKWLVDHGVPADKLTAKGYGPSKPIADNKTAAGRAKNKRIQIVVLEKK
jgi:outer membrane protein OmpA-like peptidoglycan-associated protein